MVKFILRNFIFVLVLTHFLGSKVYSMNQPLSDSQQFYVLKPPYQSLSFQGRPWDKDGREYATDLFSEYGAFFKSKKAPEAFRKSIPLGKDGFLMLELYSRDQKKN